MLLLAGPVLGGIGISSIVNFVRSDFGVYQPDSSISVTNDGFTLYAEEGALVASDLRDVRCTATGPEGQTSLRHTSGRTLLSNDLGTFVAIASTPTSLPAGRYTIACHTASAEVSVPLYLGPRIDLVAVGRLAVFGIVAPLFLGVCSAVLFAILAVMRYRSSQTPAVG